MEVSGGQEDMAFSDWSEKLEAGTSHWLPAYGFQQPSQLHEALLQHDYDVGQQSYVFLETIVEETSDDLRSESEYSAGGWPDTDSDAGSVIHLPLPVGNGGCKSEWSGSERDLAVPKKRRRRLVYNNDPGVHDDDDDEDDGDDDEEEDEAESLRPPPASSRSSSLVAFESLERECDTALFRASASSEPFHTPPLQASFSFDSLETSAWRYPPSPDSLEEDGGSSTSISSSCSSSTHVSSSDDEHLARSYSSRSAGNESYRSSLKSHRSFDSLVTCPDKSPMLSGEFSQSLNNTAVVVEEEEPAAPARGLYKTVECLTEAGRPEPGQAEAGRKPAGQRSAENLSEDSGFGEHIPRRASSSGGEKCTGIDKEEEWESRANYSHWQSAPDLLDQCDGEKAASTTSLLLNALEEEGHLPECKGLAMNTVSTPNLFGQELEEGEYELRFGDAPARAQSFKEIVAGELRKTKSKGSNIQITTSFINLNASSTSLHGSKVTFSPVVSEVSFGSARREEPKKVGPVVKVVESGGGRQPARPVPVPVEHPSSMDGHVESKKNKIGGFFQRFSLRRLSGRDKKKKEKKSVTIANGSAPPRPGASQLIEDAVTIIPLHGPEDRRPPLPPPPPPRKRSPEPPPPSAMPTGPREGLLETDLDSVGDERPPKTRSMLDLGGGSAASRPQPAAEQQDNRAKSMEFLLDKQAQFSVKPPENELQKVGERVMSEHELRVQRSLQRLNVPDWFKNSQLPSQGFLLKRHSEGGATGWQGLSSKTTSLSSLGSRSPTGNLLSPSPTPSTHTFSRWSTNRLASNPGSTSTSPSGSARSSFNYRQPYLGWRSQERLAHPRTPAERLAAGIPQKQATPPPNVPNLSEVHSSIKEVTSAIVHYVSGANKEDRLSPNPPRHDSGSSRSASPRGSTSRFCWLESSFVGNRPADVPETPVSLTATPEHGKDLYLDLNSISSPARQINDSL